MTLHTITLQHNLGIDMVDAICTLVNRAYSAGEAGMWVESTLRTSPNEIAELVLQKRIIAAFCEDELVGAIKITHINNSTLEFGQLAVAKQCMKRGIAKQLIAFVENLAAEIGYTTVRLEILFPSDGLHQALDKNEHVDMTDINTSAWKEKALLDKIYTNLNYKRVAVGHMSEFAKDYPELVNALAAPCNYIVYTKSLNE